MMSGKSFKMQYSQIEMVPVGDTKLAQKMLVMMTFCVHMCIVYNDYCAAIVVLTIHLF